MGNHKGSAGTPMTTIRIRRRKNKAQRRAEYKQSKQGRAAEGKRQIAQGEMVDGVLMLPEVKPGKRRGMA